MLEHYKTIYEGGEGELVEKKSRFIATVRPVETEEEALAFIEEMKKKYWDARHNCYVYSVGMNREATRCSDDGEPSGTAGRPMLDVLLGAGIYNAAIVAPISSIDELIAKDSLFADFKAVNEGNVWCTTNDMYQQSMSIGYLMQDIHRMLLGEDEGEMKYLFQLK